MNHNGLPKIAVLAGGYSGEAAISIKSASTIVHNIDRSKYTPFTVRIDRDLWWVELEGNTRADIDRESFTWKDSEGVHNTFDAVFIMVHGTPGEDGILQKYFETLEIPFSTGASDSVCLTFNKFKANNTLRAEGICVADSIEIKREEVLSESRMSDIAQIVKMPCFVKPNKGGSSLGVTRVENTMNLRAAIEFAFDTGCPTVVIESLLEGREFSVGVVPDENGTPMVLPVTEIITENVFFDYAAKYEGGSQEITPAKISSESSAMIKETVVKATEILKCKWMVRVDIILVNGENPAVIEVNSVPGFTDESILPQQLSCAGIKFRDVISRILNGILDEHTK
ncbi:MAG: ATP-grasp domain-containing protein [Flavobacteriales bacterium]|nr:ATP-grasp domain-containing protein [Flavobacteriales bacterium]